MPLPIRRYGNANPRTVVLVHGLTEAGTTWPDLAGHLGRRLARPRSRPARSGAVAAPHRGRAGHGTEVLLTVVDAQTEPVGSSGTRCVASGAAGLTDGAQTGAGAQRPGPDRRGARWQTLRPDS